MTRAGVQETRSVLVLSHLYPSSANPGSGLFVRDEVRELSGRNRIAVVSPVNKRLLRSRKHRVVFDPYEVIEDGLRVVRPRFPGVPIMGRLIEPRMWAFRLQPLLRRVYDEIQGDLVHAHFALPDGFAAAYFTTRANVPLVLTVWGSDLLVRGRERISRGLLRRTLPRADAVVAVSAELAERARGLGANQERIFVVPGGVPYPDRIPTTIAQELLDPRASGPHLLWVGSFVPVKQPLDAILAFELFRRTDAGGSTLTMIGGGPLLERARRLVKDRGLAGHVALLGHQPRSAVWRWQCAVDLVVNSSRSEGTPLAVLEALGAGTSVAAYPLPGVRAVVEGVGGGVIASEASPNALAAAVVEALAAAGDRDVVARLARRRFSIESTARSLQEVYGTVR